MKQMSILKIKKRHIIIQITEFERDGGKAIPYVKTQGMNHFFQQINYLVSEIFKYSSETPVNIQV